VKRSALLKPSRRQERYFKKASEPRSRSPSWSYHHQCSNETKSSFKPEINDKAAIPTRYQTTKHSPASKENKNALLLEKLKSLTVSGVYED
jgi:hypothetical protein